MAITTIINTAECLKLATGTGEAITTKIDISRIEWANNGGGAGDQLVITDGSDKPIAHMVAATAESSQQLIINKTYKGIKLATNGGGTIYIHKGKMGLS